MMINRLIYIDDTLFLAKHNDNGVNDDEPPTNNSFSIVFAFQMPH